MITKKISHFGILVFDAEATTKLWTKSFGLQKFDGRRIEVGGIRSIFVSVGGTWDEMIIEIMDAFRNDGLSAEGLACNIGH